MPASLAVGAPTLAVGTSVRQTQQDIGQHLIDRQRELEDHMLGLGGERFRREVARAQASKEASTSGAGVKLLRHAIDPVEQGIRALIEDKKKRGPKHQATRWLSLCDPAAAAFITARIIIDGIHSRSPLRITAVDIASTLLDELRYRRLEKARPALFKYKVSRLPGSNYQHNKKVLDQTMRWALEHKREGDEELDVSDLTMTEQQKLVVGLKLVDIFVQTTQLVRLVSQRRTRTGARGRRYEHEQYLEATDETKEWLEKRNSVLEFLTPINLPTVIPPRPWRKHEKGGYHFALRDKEPFVRGASAEQMARVKAADIPLVYEAVNRIQATAWRINKRVLELVEEVIARDSTLGSLPFADVGEEEIPAKPVDIATNEEARKAWRKAARLAHERNHLRRVRANGLAKVLLAARKVADEERIYFPCSLDFRGRIYPLTHYLTPQGDDLSKALLTFADAKPLGPDGAYWLAIHGANCLDVTPEGQKIKTMTMAERATWIQRHTLRICRVADDPFADLWWTEADEPLQFFAFCCEWRGFYAAYCEGKGDDYVCGLPISQDGSCNGLQHFSAMLRDPIGGKAVNLTPEDRPQDVYDAVAADVKAQVEAESDWFATRWSLSGLIGRKLCKRPTMTFCYGSKRFGMAEQTLQFMQEDRLNWQKLRSLFSETDGENKASAAAQWMADRIWSALAGTVVAASQAMAWMQECARIVVAASHQPVEWTVPVTNFPVRQDYFVMQFKQIKTVLAGQVIQPSVLHQTNEVLTHKQTNAIAPNVVHSLDAAALMMTVVGAAECGVESFGMIHDSYATVPADCGVLAQITREAFTSLYRDNDVIGLLAQCFAAQAVNSEKPLPAPPQPGTLDISGVLESTYFFS